MNCCLFIVLVCSSELLSKSRFARDKGRAFKSQMLRLILAESRLSLLPTPLETPLSFILKGPFFCRFYSLFGTAWERNFICG